MKRGFLRVRDPERGAFTALVGDDEVFDVSPLEVLGLIRERRFNDAAFLDWILSQCTPERLYPLPYSWLWQQPPLPEVAHLLMPVEPPEVWGVGVSYKRTAQLHEEDIEAKAGMTGLYAYVFESQRPEVFFKGLPRHCVGHNGPITIRGDSRGTVVEAELACILDSDSAVVGFTIANDVTAWDIELESPLFLSYAKIFKGSCALGPMAVPARWVADPLALAVVCEIERNGERLFRGDGNTRNMRRSLGELIANLSYCNQMPDGAILCTGTAVGMSRGMAVEDGDLVTISLEQLGSLRNSVRRAPRMSIANGSHVVSAALEEQ